MKRIYIESDILDEGEYHRAQRNVYRIHDGKDLPDEVFDEVIDKAAFRMEETWTAVKSADEIYADSSLVSLSGYGSYNGAPLIFNTMMEASLKEGITGKKLIFLKELEDLEWDNIDLEVMLKVFEKNEMFTFEDRVVTPVNIPDLVASLTSNKDEE